ncbi:MAG: caspase family protein, partial [Smithellaceae bacterium]|nr:caspase family protein [Smithellaceae bacterium]
YREVTVRLLTDAQALKDDILDGLDWVRKAVTQHDVGIVFLAGHGVNDADGTYYYLPVQADHDRLLRTGVRLTDIQTTLASMPGKALFFVDTCHAGSVMGRRGTIDLTRLINELSSAESGAVVFAASTGRQFSLEDERWQNGAFTKALLEGLSGNADYQKDGVITIKELDLYISERVKELTQGKQSPTTTVPKTIPDFPVVMY